MSAPIPGGIAPLPDAEAVIADYLATAASIQALGDGAEVSVGDRLPATFDGSTDLAVTLDRIGGSPGGTVLDVWIDTAHLDVKAWAPSKKQAYTLIAAVRPLLAVARFQDVAGAVVQDVVEQVGPQWFPDPGGDYPQSGYYLLQVAVTLHP